MLLQNAAIRAKKVLVEIGLLGVVSKVSIGKYCLVKHFAFLENVCCKY